MTKTRLSKAIALCFATSTLFSTSHVQADTFPVTVNNDNGTGLVANTLSWAILQANSNPGADEIVLQTDVTVTGVMKRLIDSDTTLTSDNTRRTISGNDEFRPLFIKSGQVTIKDLDINNGFAKGGESRNGGAGAGMGGGLFIYDGNINLQNVIFSNNTAQGGEASTCHWRTCTGGGGMFGKSNRGGGGLFEEANGSTGGYGGSNQYQNNDLYFGQGGNASPSTYIPGRFGGFGGGGGYGIYAAGGHGGFGAGGGFAYDYYYYQQPISQQYSGGNGGFGAGGGRSYSETNNGLPGFGGNSTLAAGLGGALFIRSGHVNLSNTQFNNNQAKKTTVNQISSDGFGGGIFILHDLNNINGNNQGMPSSLASIEICHVNFNNNHADSEYQSITTNDVFAFGTNVTDLCPTYPEFNLYSGQLLIMDGDDTPDVTDHTDFGSITVDLETHTQTYSIVNSGDAELHLTATPIIEIQSPSGQFSITEQPSASSLAPQEMVTFEVTFSPQSQGYDEATIVIANNDLNVYPFDFVIAAEGIAPAPKLQVTYQDQIIDAEDITPSLTDGTDFGYSAVAGGLVKHTFEIHNVGFAPLEFTNQASSIQTFSFDNSMSITSQPSQFELQPNESIPFTVSFDPTQVGPSDYSYVSIHTNDPNHPYFFYEVKGYGQATLHLNALKTDVQEGEDLVFEIVTDLPIYGDTWIEYSLAGEIDDSDFSSNPPLSGQVLIQSIPATNSSELLYFPTIQDGVTEGLEYISFAILSEDPAINQTTPFIVQGSIDDDLIFVDGFEGNQNH